MRVSIIPNVCKECSNHMHIYDMQGNDTEVDEYHCENGRSVVIHEDKPNYIHKWCPLHKVPEQMSLFEFMKA